MTGGSVLRGLTAVLLAFAVCFTGNECRAEAVRLIGNGGERVVYLTFDDGPDTENTLKVMEVLMDYNAQGTFFFTGVNMNKFPEVVKKVYDNGFTIGLHSYAHASYAKMSAQGVREDILAANDVLESITGERSLNIRPPYGAYNGTTMSVLDSMGFTSYLWSIDPRDWSSSATDASVMENIKANIKPGAIILLHSSSGQDRAGRILGEIIEYISSQGYKMEALPDAGYKTVPVIESDAGISINGGRTGQSAYIINGGTFLGIRDLAEALRGTSKEFDIGWETEGKSVVLKTGREYRQSYHETAAASSRGRATPFEGGVLINGDTASIKAYSFDGTLLFHAGELSEALGIEVNTSGSPFSIIVSGKIYEDKSFFTRAGEFWKVKIKRPAVSRLTREIGGGLVALRYINPYTPLIYNIYRASTQESL